MDLSKILSISGKRGLFKVVSQLKNAVLVESLIDGKRFPAFAHEKISSLEEISVFTTGEDISLKEVLKKVYEKQEGKAGPDSKIDDKGLKIFFLTVLPDYDPDRVYISDIRKMISWYNLLIDHQLLDFTEKKEEEGEKGESGEEHKKPEPAAPVKKQPARPKKPSQAGSEKTSKARIANTQTRSKKSEG